MELQLVNKFLSNWEHRDIVDGVLLTGSRNIGMASNNSDIDLQILISDSNLRERGNQVVDGILIEYFANPTAHIMKYLEQEKAAFHRPTVRMYATGKILLDKHGDLAQACQAANEYFKLPLPPMSAGEIEAAKYSIWDCFDDLQELYEHNRTSFPYVYHLNLNKVLTLYARFLGAELTAPSKQEVLFSSPEFRTRYVIPDFPDSIFAGLFLECVSAQEHAEMYHSFAQLTEHALTAMGGFYIDGWRSRIHP